APMTSYPSYSSVIRSESRMAPSSSTIRIRGLGMKAEGIVARSVGREVRSGSPFVHVDRQKLALFEIRHVHVKSKDIAGTRCLGDPLVVCRRFDRLPVDFEEYGAAAHVGVERRAQRLDPGDEHAPRRARQIELAERGRIEVAHGQSQKAVGIVFSAVGRGGCS